MSELESSKRVQQLMLLYWSELENLVPASNESGVIVGRKLLELVRQDLEIALPGCTRNAADKVVEMFLQYRESFGDDRKESLDRQVEYEDSMKELLCEFSGRHFCSPDDCGKPEHDYCVMCGSLAADLWLERDPERPWKYRQVKPCESASR